MKGIYPFGANIYQKLPILAIFRAASLHLESQSGKIWREGAYVPKTPSPKPNFVEIFKGVYSFLANLYDKLPILTISGALSPHFKSHNGES